MNSTTLIISAFCQLHNEILGSRSQEFETLSVLVGDKCRVGLTIIGAISGQHIPLELERHVLAENIATKYVFQPCSMANVSLDSYYIFNPSAASLLLDDCFWRGAKRLGDRSWTDCFTDMEILAFELSARQVRKELGLRGLLTNRLFRNLGNTQAQLGYNDDWWAKLREDIDWVEKRFRQWSEGGFVTHSFEEHVDSFLTGRLVRELLVLQKDKVPIINHPELIGKMVELIRS